MRRNWPLELSRHLPHTVKIYGFDVSTSMFPAKQWLPANVHLDTLDMLSSEQLPEGLAGVFDVVHVRAFACVVKGGDPSGVLERLIKMLSESHSTSRYDHSAFFWLAGTIAYIMWLIPSLPCFCSSPFGARGSLMKL